MANGTNGGANGAAPSWRGAADAALYLVNKGGLATVLLGLVIYAGFQAAGYLTPKLDAFFESHQELMRTAGESLRTADEMLERLADQTEENGQGIEQARADLRTLQQGVEQVQAKLQEQQ